MDTINTFPFLSHFSKKHRRQPPPQLMGPENRVPKHRHSINRLAFENQNVKTKRLVNMKKNNGKPKKKQENRKKRLPEKWKKKQQKWRKCIGIQYQGAPNVFRLRPVPDH